MSNILIVGLNFYPELTGIGKYSGELAAFLAVQGHAVRVITTPPYYPHWQIQNGYHAGRYQKETWQAVEIYRCPLWVPRRPKGLTRLIHLASFAISSLPVLMAQLRWKPDVVLSIAPALMNAPFVLAFARLSGAKSWLHIQDFELDAAVKLKMLPGGQLIFPLARAIERFILARFARVSTISENMRLRSIEKGVKSGRTFLLPNWVDTKKIHPLQRPGSLRAELKIPSQAFVALYHGNMGYKQGLELLPETACLLQSRPEILFVICGEGPAKEKLVEISASLPNIRFLDIQTEDKMNELVNLADVHLLPQLANCADLVMPSKLTTILASGKPVIAGAYECTQISEIVATTGVLVEPENPAALAAALIKLSDDPLERLRLGNLGRAYACQHLDKELILSRLHIFLMDDICDKNVKTGPIEPIISSEFLPPLRAGPEA